MPGDFFVPVPEDIEKDIVSQQSTDVYEGTDSDPVSVNYFTDFFADHYTEHAAIKSFVDMCAGPAGHYQFDQSLGKLKNKPKVTSTELSKALNKDLEKKVDVPVHEKKYEKSLARVTSLACKEVATFLANSHSIPRKAFLKEMGPEGLIQAVEKLLFRSSKISPLRMK